MRYVCLFYSKSLAELCKNKLKMRLTKKESHPRKSYYESFFFENTCTEKQMTTFHSDPTKADSSVFIRCYSILL